VRVSGCRPDGKTAATIIEAQCTTVDVLVTTEAELAIAALAPLAIAAPPNAEAATRVRCAVHLQCHLAGEQLALTVERVGIGAVRLRARLIEEGLGLRHGHVVDCGDQRSGVSSGAGYQALEAAGDRELVGRRRGAE